MNDLFEIVEDLKDIEAWSNDNNPAIENILIKWEARLEDAQDEAERQFELFEMDDGAQTFFADSVAQLDRASDF